MHRWIGHGDDWPIMACNGEKAFSVDGNSWEPGLGQYYPAGSYWVMPGCRAFFFENGDFTGGRKVANPGLVPHNTWGSVGGSNPPGPGSFKCSCDSSPLNCVPSDGWDTVFSYDNSDGKVAVTVKYEKSIGTSHSETVTQSMSESIEVKAEMSASFEDLFSASLTATSTTGFDWSSANTDTFSETTTITDQLVIRPGKKAVLQQAVGTCGYSKVRTSMFQILT